MATYISTLEMPAIVSPGLSLAAHGRIYFDSGINQFLHSDNAGAYAPFGQSGGTTGQTRLEVIQPAHTTGSPAAVRVVGGAHTTLTASTEASDIIFDLARNVQFSTGNIATQRAVRISAPTYAFVAASTISDAATVSISGAPIAGANATFTRSFALWIETGALGIGAAAARASGDVRTKHAFSWVSRNSTDLADIQIWDWGATTANILMFGNTADTVQTIRIRANGVTEFYNGSALRAQVESTALHFHDGNVGVYSLRLNGQQMIGFNQSGTTRNIAFFNNGSAAFNSLDRGLYLLNALAVAVADPVGGFYHWSNAGVPAWRTSAGNIMIASFISAAAATAGAGAATPATVREFLTVTYNGTVCKFALYDN